MLHMYLVVQVMLYSSPESDFLVDHDKFYLVGHFATYSNWYWRREMGLKK